MFELEEENRALKHRLEVDMTNEVGQNYDRIHPIIY